MVVDGAWWLDWGRGCAGPHGAGIGKSPAARPENLGGIPMQVDKDVLQDVFSEIEELRDEALERVTELVETPSVVGNEGPAQKIIHQMYEELDLNIDTFTADEVEGVLTHPQYCGLEELPPQERYRGRPNVVGTLPGQEDASSLILNGHIDVVSAEPEDRWTYPPWKATIVGDRLYGRGAGDMKGGLVAAWAALRAMLSAGYRPRGTVQLQSVIEEEAGGGGGALACFLRGHHADAFIAVEPTAHGVRIGNGGILYFRINVQGRTAHAGTADAGVSAVEKMAPIISALQDLDRRRGYVEHSLFPASPRGRTCYLNIGKYRAGDWPSTVPGWAEIEARISFLPGETSEEVKSEVEDAVYSAADDEWLKQHPPEIEWFGWNAEPRVEEEDDPFVVLVRDTVQEVLEQPASVFAHNSGVDSRFAHMFDSVGICLGPAGGNIHGIDEYVEIESIFESARILAAITLRWCGTEKL